VNKNDELIIGPHKVRCGDILEDSVAKLMGFEKAHIIYSDPPWGEGNVRFWRTHNNQREIAHSFRWDDFITKFCQIVADYATGPVFIEMGMRWVDEMADRFKKLGIPEYGRWTALYGSPKLPVAGWFGWPAAYGKPTAMPELVDGLSGLKGLKIAMAPYVKPGAIVLDPCCGLGSTAKVALSLGMTFRGNELNPIRLARTVEFLEKKAGSAR
jgi:hypothetical protein